MAGAKKKESVIETLGEELERELAAVGSKGDFVDIAENISDMSIECVTTGFPALDLALHPELKGLPCGRDIEIFSKNAESGKTSLALQIGAAWQRAKKRVYVIDVENTIDGQFLIKNGLTWTDPDVYPVKFLTHGMGMGERPDGILTVEEILNKIKKYSGIMDLIIVDSVAAMEKNDNLDKMADQNNQQGGISKSLSEFMRKNVNKRASIIWINQSRYSMAYSAGGAAPMVTPGGKALEFYTSIRLSLTMIERLKNTDADPPYGMKIKVMTEKNKVAPQWRWANLTYLFGQGFSMEFDYVQMAIQLHIIEKKGGWFSYGPVKLQGLLPMVLFFKNNPVAFGELKAQVDGEPVGPLSSIETAVA